MLTPSVLHPETWAHRFGVIALPRPPQQAPHLPSAPGGGATRLEEPMSASHSGHKAGPSATGVPPAPAARFVPAATFQGKKEGFVFKRDAHGLGYYEDTFYKDGGPGAGVPGAARKSSGVAKVKSDSLLEEAVGNFVCFWLAKGFEYGGPDGKHHWGGKAWKDMSL